MFLIGILPALLTLWIRTSIDELQTWQQIDAKRRDANARKQSGATLSPDDQALTRFTVADLFAEPETRRRTILVFLMSLTTTLAWWGISSWVPPYIASIAVKADLPGPQWASYAGMAYNFGAILGYASLGFLADRFGRKPIVMLYFAAAFLMTPVLFLWTQDLSLLLVAAAVNAFFTLGQYSWMAVWLPELFPTRSRATGLAFTFNAPRFIAFLGPLFAGVLIVQFGGFSRAAMTISPASMCSASASRRSCRRPRASRCRRRCTAPSSRHPSQVPRIAGPHCNRAPVAAAVYPLRPARTSG